MSTYNIFRRMNGYGGNARTLVFVESVVAKDSFDAMKRFCGEASNANFVAMHSNWNCKSYYIANAQAMA